MVAYRAYRYNDGSANNAELKREVQVKSAEEALKFIEIIERAAKRYKDECAGIHEDDSDDDAEKAAKEAAREAAKEAEQDLIDDLIGGYCGGFFYPGAKAYVDHIRREVLQLPTEVKGAA
jgi:membrane protein involved in colicin uptake